MFQFMKNISNNKTILRKRTKSQKKLSLSRASGAGNSSKQALKMFSTRLFFI